MVRKEWHLPLRSRVIGRVCPHCLWTIASMLLLGVSELLKILEVARLKVNMGASVPMKSRQCKSEPVGMLQWVVQI